MAGDGLFTNPHGQAEGAAPKLSPVAEDAQNSAKTPTPANLGRPWPPGRSGNPGGRPKRRALTAELVAELDQPARGKSGVTKGQRLAERLVSIALNGRRADSISAIRLIMAYTDGLPAQTFEVDLYDTAKQLAEQRGLDPGRVANLLDEVRSTNRS